MRYGVAIGAAILALLVRFPLAPFLGSTAPYLTFFVATTASAVFGGFGPGLVTTLSGAFLALAFILPSASTFSLGNFDSYLGPLLRFVAICGFISYLTGRLSEARRHEVDLRQYFQQTLLSIGDGVISTDEKRRVLLMNPIAEELTGWTLGEAKGKVVDDVFRVVQEGSNPPVDVPIVRSRRGGISAQTPDHSELIARNGRRVPIDDDGAPIKDPRGVDAGTVLVFRDISPRRQAELRLEESERRSRAILESISDAFGQVDREWRFAYVNSAAERMTGRLAHELIGKNLWEVYPGTLGTIIETSFRSAMTERKPVSFENYYVHWNRWFDTSAYPSDIGLSVYFRDITERKRSEQALQRLNEDLKQFTYAATHDLREPLRMMTVNAQMLQRKLDTQLGDDGLRYVSDIVNGGKRISGLIDGLLQFSRVGETAEAGRVPVDTESAFKEALLDLHLVIRETHAHVTHSPLPKVMADHAHVRQIFQNLVGNAIKYHRPNIKPEVLIAARREAAECVFSVHDNGIGIDSQHYDQIFVPFKRLHGPEIAGSGIGLATCKRIVELHGGRIWVESQLRTGSNFYFALHAAEEVSHGQGE